MKYFGFDGLEDIKKQFQSECNGITEDEILFASYGSQCYDGDAIVLIRRDGKLYTVESSHCSCNGLEHSWDMIETTKEVLKNRQRHLDEHYHRDFLIFLKGFLESGS